MKNFNLDEHTGRILRSDPPHFVSYPIEEYVALDIENMNRIEFEDALDRFEQDLKKYFNGEYNE